LDSQIVRSFLTLRARLVEMRVDLTNQIRGMLKPFGLVAGKGGRQPLIDRVRPLVGDEPLKDVVEALLIALQASAGQSAFSPADS
jgi:transposase